MTSSRGSGKSPKPTILIDRCLPDAQLANGFRRDGYDAHTLEDVFPGRGAHVFDTEWLQVAGDAGWIALTQNPQIWHVRHERQALLDHSTRVFSLAAADLPNPHKGFTFGRWWPSIMRRAKSPAACFWRLYPDRPPARYL